MPICNERNERFHEDHLNSLLPGVPVSRRGFLVGAAGVSLTISAQSIMAQQAIRTPAEGLVAENVEIPVPGGAIPAYYAHPQQASEALAAVIVVPEVWGLQEYQRDMARRLAHAGHFCVSYNPFFRSGGDLANESNLQNIMKAVNQLHDNQMRADLDSLVGWINTRKNVNSRRIGITGMCMGGRTVWMYAAHSRQIRAGVSWYGVLGATPPARPLTPMDVADKLNAPVLGLYAGADSGIPLEQVERMRAALVAAGKERESPIYVYDGMPHGFHADHRASYRKEQAEDGWKRMLAWFKQHGV